jgi:hypothetical protein
LLIDLEFEPGRESESRQVCLCSETVESTRRSKDWS